MRAILARRRARRAERLERREAWARAAAEVGGELFHGAPPDKDKVLLRHGPWRVWMDTYVQSAGQAQVVYTRVRAYFRGHRGLRLTVRRRRALDGLVRALGFGSPPPLRRELLEQWIVRGRPPSRIPSLFAEVGLTEALLVLPAARLEVKRAGRRSRNRIGEDAGVVTCRTRGVVREPERLVAMMGVVAAALDAVRRVGEADDREAE